MRMPTYEEVSRLFAYDPESGVLRRLTSISQAKAGDVAGTLMVSGHLSVSVANRKQYVHRIIWCLMTGKWPAQRIDHIDGDGANNRWSNLRLATHAENLRNSRLSKNNTTGRKGVSLVRGRFRASIWLDGTAKHLGVFDSADAAHAAYTEAAKQHFGEFARTQ